MGHHYCKFLNTALLVKVITINSIMMQTVLYPNETRVQRSFSQLWFKPYMSLFGEMFKPETATYAFDSVADCEPSYSIMRVPDSSFVWNKQDTVYVYQTTNKKRFKIKVRKKGVVLICIY